MKRYWIVYEEPWVNALLLDAPNKVNVLELPIVKDRGTVKSCKEEEFSCKAWQYTNTDYHVI